MTEADKTIRDAVIEAQRALALHIIPGGPDDAATINKLLKILDRRSLLRALEATSGS